MNEITSPGSNLNTTEQQLSIKIKQLEDEYAKVEKEQRDRLIHIAEFKKQIGITPEQLNSKEVWGLVVDLLKEFNRHHQESIRYKNISLADAIFKCLESSNIPLSTKDIANKLLSGGYQNESKNFNALISTTLSRMYHSKNGPLVISENRKWRLPKSENKDTDSLNLPLR